MEIKFKRGSDLFVKQKQELLVISKNKCGGWAMEFVKYPNSDGQHCLGECINGVPHYITLLRTNKPGEF